MQITNRLVDFFMGANSPDGFYSLYDEFREPQAGVRRFLIKGGAGTGKSTLMRKAAETACNYEPLMEYIHCSSDPNSLDGVVFHTGGCSIVDATPPHVIEPTYPGGFETVVNLCDYFDDSKLEKRLDRIVELQTANNACHRKCRGLLKCADILLKDNAYVAEGCTDFAKAHALAEHICKAELPDRKTSQPGKEWKRLLSAVTNQGVVTYTGTAAALCDRLYLLRDDYGVSSHAILQRIREDALQKGYDLFTCRCPLSPSNKLEHLFLPELRLGFVTQNRWNDFSDLEGVPSLKVIHFTRFTDMERLRKKKQYLSFNRKAAAELIQAAVEELKRAKAIHDRLEEQYTDAVDFTGVTQKTAEVCQRIQMRYEDLRRDK